MGLFELIYHKRIITEFNQAKLAIQRMHNECAAKEQLYLINRRIFELAPNARIVSIEKNKNDEDVFVTWEKSGESVSVKLFGRSYQAINRLPRIYAEIKQDYNATAPFATYYAIVDDVLVEDINIGNGSIIMKYFLQYIEEMRQQYHLNIIRISGELSSVDKDHFNRSEAFYKKFGFTVTFNETRSSGRIEKRYPSI